MPQFIVRRVALWENFLARSEYPDAREGLFSLKRFWGPVHSWSLSKLCQNSLSGFFSCLILNLNIEAEIALFSAECLWVLSDRKAKVICQRPHKQANRSCLHLFFCCWPEPQWDQSEKVHFHSLRFAEARFALALFSAWPAINKQYNRHRNCFWNRKLSGTSWNLVSDYQNN